MRFEKGNDFGKGRTKGAKNKNNEALRGYLLELLQDNREQLKDDLKALKPLERVQTYIQLAKVVLPSLKQVEMSADINQDNNNDLINRLMAIDEKQFEKLYENG